MVYFVLHTQHSGESLYYLPRSETFTIRAVYNAGMKFEIPYEYDCLNSPHVNNYNQTESYICVYDYNIREYYF